MNLRIQSLNFDFGVLTVHDGKGKKDRTVPLPQTIMPDLKAHLERVKKIHGLDPADDYADAFMFDSIEKKYKNCAKEFVWQWLFPAKTLTFVPITKEYRRYHLHESHVQKAIKRAVNKAEIPKRARAHQLCKPFVASQLRHPYDTGTTRSQRCQNHHDLYPYRQKCHDKRGQKPA